MREAKGSEKYSTRELTPCRVSEALRRLNAIDGDMRGPKGIETRQTSTLLPTDSIFTLEDHYAARRARVKENRNNSHALMRRRTTSTVQSSSGCDRPENARDSLETRERISFAGKSHDAVT